MKVRYHGKKGKAQRPVCEPRVYTVIIVPPVFRRSGQSVAMEQLYKELEGLRIL